MRELGRRGGRTPKMTALRRAAAAQDDELRGQARQVLAKAPAGEEVDREQLAAAKSLFSYRSDAPPPAERSRSGAGRPKIISLGDILDAAFESHGVLELHGELRCCGKVWTRP